MYRYKNLIKGAGLTVGLLTLVNVQTASATVYEYFVRGNVNAPIMVDLNGQSINPGHATFGLDFDHANVILSYNDGGTASKADDFMTIKGSVNGVTTYDGYDPNVQRLSNYHFAVGHYTYQLDIAATNPIASMTTGGTDFAFGMQQAGTVKVTNAPAGWEALSYWDSTSTVTLKADKNFAFDVYQDPNNPNQLIGEGWLALMNGFLGVGNGSRWEFGYKNANLNWNFHLVPTGNTQIPEPFSASLLSLGLLGGGYLRKRKANL